MKIFLSSLLWLALNAFANVVVLHSEFDSKVFHHQIEYCSNVAKIPISHSIQLQFSNNNAICPAIQYSKDLSWRIVLNGHDGEVTACQVYAMEAPPFSHVSINWESCVDDAMYRASAVKLLFAFGSIFSLLSFVSAMLSPNQTLKWLSGKSS